MAIALVANAHGRLRAGWWIVIFLLSLLALLVPLIVLASARQQSVAPWQQALAVLAASVICQALRRRPLGEMFGVLNLKWCAEFLVGSALGLALMALPAVVLVAIGAVTFRLNAPDSAAWVQLVWVFVAVAVTEEVMFRGFAFQRLIDGLGVWLAQLVGAAFFLLTHSDALRNAGAQGLLGGVNIFLASLMFGVAFVGTGSLAMPIGIHLAANVTQGALLGFGVSGSDTQGWLVPVLEGPAWLTGGNFGLEASVVGLISLIGLMVGLMYWRGVVPLARP